MLSIFSFFYFSPHVLLSMLSSFLTYFLISPEHSLELYSVYNVACVSYLLIIPSCTSVSLFLIHSVTSLSLICYLLHHPCVSPLLSYVFCHPCVSYLLCTVFHHPCVSYLLCTVFHHLCVSYL